jgi:hypothetical protein
MAGALHDIVRGREQRGAATRENNGVGMQWPQAAVSEEWHIEIERRPHELSSNYYADEHTHDAPDHGHYRELAYHFVVI